MPEPKVTHCPPMSNQWGVTYCGIPDYPKHGLKIVTDYQQITCGRCLLRLKKRIPDFMTNVTNKA